MWAFIEHHALRSSGHCRISHLGSRGQTSLNQGLEHLRRPDHRHMSRLADPKNLLLDLRHSLEPNLHPEIASGHHHCGYWPAHYPKQNPRKSFHGGTVLDFEDDPGSRRSKAIEFLDQFRHIFGPPDKGEGDQIAIFRREFEVLAVFGCQRRILSLVSGRLMPFSARSLAVPLAACVILTSSRGSPPSLRSSWMTPSILPSSKKMRSPGFASLKTSESEQPICAGR